MQIQCASSVYTPDVIIIIIWVNHSRRYLNQCVQSKVVYRDNKIFMYKLGVPSQCTNAVYKPSVQAQVEVLTNFRNVFK